MLAAYGEVKRQLCTEVPDALKNLQQFVNPQLAMPGVITLQTDAFSNYATAVAQMDILDTQLKEKNLGQVAIIVICDDSSFTAATLNNYLWVTYTRSNPSHDIYGIRAFTHHKQLGAAMDPWS